ncbi:MAG: hypothetical protein CSA76_05850 [Spirochaetales bacterium]|nr:MAG: hypothetical protein CSA76_05850 [Spirochaetales bacterium]
MKNKLFTYSYNDTFIHNLTGLTKLLGFIFLSFGVMFSYDIRYVLSVLIFSFIMFRVAKIPFSKIKIMLIYVLIFVCLNAVLTYLFAPEYGVQLYGTRHELYVIFGRYSLTLEQLLYQSTKTLKYMAVIPLGMIFFLGTDPSEFAASLSRIGVHYKIAFPVALTLRYFPDIQRAYINISRAQQARGLEISSKAPFLKRVKNALTIIVPLIFSSLERVDTISNAMDLRGFGKNKKRTWYRYKKLQRNDYIAMFITAVIFAVSIFLSAVVNHSRFYNPFI